MLLACALPRRCTTLTLLACRCGAVAAGLSPQRCCCWPVAAALLLLACPRSAAAAAAAAGMSLDSFEMAL